MTQCINALANKPDDLSSSSQPHTVERENYKLSWGFHIHDVTHAQAHTHTQINKNEIRSKSNCLE